MTPPPDRSPQAPAEPAALDPDTVSRAFEGAGGPFFADADISQRLNLIRHLVQSTQLTVLVTGASGIGKSTSLRQLHATADERWSLCRVAGDVSLGADELLAALARCCDLPPDCGRLALRHLLAEHAGGLSRNTRLPVIAVDDAHRLPAAALAELAALWSADNGWHLLLFAEPGDTERFEQAGIGSGGRLHALDWPRLSEAQTGAYLAHRLAAAGWQGPQPLRGERLRKLHRDSGGLPGAIDRLAPPMLVQAPAPAAAVATATKRARKPFPLRRVLQGLALLALIAAAAAVLLLQDRINALFEQPGAIPPAPSSSAKPLPDAADSPLAFDDSGSTPQPIAPPLASGTAAGDEPEAPVETAPAPASEMPDTTAVAPAPEQMAGTPPGAVSRDTQTPTAEHSPATPEAAQSPPKPETEAEPPKAPPQPAPAPDTGTPAPAADDTATPDSGAGEPASPAAATATGPDAALTDGEPAPALSGKPWLMARPAGHYTLQLLGSRELKPLLERIAHFDLGTETAWYKVQYHGADWYVLVHGDYPDSTAAVKAVQALPPGLRRAGPWPRPFSAVQAEVRSGRK